MVQPIAPRPPRPPRDRKTLIAEARTLGFDRAAIARPEGVARLGRTEKFHDWLDQGRHGDMTWMAERADWRADPRALWPAVRSILMVAANYAPATDPLPLLDRKAQGVIAAYARRRDYHEVMKGRLKRLAGRAAAATGQAVKVFVDTAPVLEKPLAQAAGLGWQGKHTNLVVRDLGSWTFLGSLFMAAEFTPDEPLDDHCGSCRRCLDACPTGAFPAPYQLDARRCIAYLTIELKGQIPTAFRPLIGNRIYGCDDCLAVCPWNKFAETARDLKLVERVELAAPALADLAGLDDRAFRARFAGTPVKRLGRDRFLRNVLVAIGNSATPALLPRILQALDEPHPLVRGMAVWALARLNPRHFIKEHDRRWPAESDPTVIAEWNDGRQIEAPAPF